MTAVPRTSAIERFQRVLPWLESGLCLLVVLLAGLALAGWGLGSVFLVRVLPLPGADIMVPSAALGVLAGALALGVLRSPRAGPRQRKLGRALAALTLLVGLLTLLEYGLGVDLGIDLLLFPETVQRLSAQQPGRPVPLTALSFCLLGLALLLMDAKLRGDRYPAEYLALGAGLIALEGVLSYLYLAQPLFALTGPNVSLLGFAPMPVHTALSCLALSAGILLARPERGAMAVVLSGSVGGLMARRLIPAAILIPIVAGWFRLFGQQLGFYGTELGVSLLVLMTIMGFLFVIVRNARALQELEARRLGTEEALRESEERFRTAYHDAPIGMALVRLDGRFLTVNHALCEIVGYSQLELLGKTFQEITYPEDLELDLANVRRLLEGEISSYQLEKRYIHKQGHLVTILLTASVVRDRKGAPSYFISQIQDITERKRSELASRFLADAGPQLADSLEVHATLAIVAKVVIPTLADWCAVELADEAGRIVRTECKAASPVKETALRAFLARASHDPERQGGLVAGVLRTGKPLFIPEVPYAALEATAEDAEHLALLHQLAPLSGMVVPLTAHGRTLGVIVLATSESRRRYGPMDLQLAMELARRAALAIDNARLYQQSEQATRMRDEVLRVVAHDLRSPLQTIALSTGMILKRLPQERAEDRKPLETVQRAVSRGSRLIEDLLDVACIESGHFAVKQEPHALAALSEESLELHRPLAAAKGLQLSASLPEHSPLLWVDRDRFLQVLSNLLGNALKFTPAGGRITLGAHLDGDSVRLSVTDTGPGIAPEHLPHVFTAFWQAQRGGKSGAGLGLAIARGIVEAHGGRLWVESPPGAGTSFFFTLPTVEPEKKKGPGF